MNELDWKTSVAMRGLKAFVLMGLALGLLVFASSIWADQTKQTSVVEITADQILKELEAGEDINYEDVVIRGVLDLTSLPSQEVEVQEKLKRVVFVSSNIRIANSDIKGAVRAFDESFDESKEQEISTLVIFQGFVEFPDTTFSNSVSFVETQFIEFADFAGANFVGFADFEEAQFAQGVGFFGTQFSGFAEFSDATFSGFADFEQALFARDVDFFGTKFLDDADFEQAQFSGFADFSEVTFSGNVDFFGTKFSDNVDFFGAEFSGPADFFNARFSGEAFFQFAAFKTEAAFAKVLFESLVSFFEAEFTGLTAFSSARFEGPAIFTGAKFNEVLFASDEGPTIFFGQADFRDAQFRTGVADFENVSFNEVDFSNTDFVRGISLKDTSYKSLNIDSLDKLFSRDVGTLKSLEDNFKSRGQLNLANETFYLRNVAEREGKPLIFGIGELIFVELLFGYGVRIWNPVIVSIVLILVFAVLYLISDAVRSKPKEDRHRFSFRISQIPIESVADEGDANAPPKPIHRVWDALNFSFSVFTKLGTQGRVARRWHKIVLIEWSLGLILMAGIFYVLSNTVPVVQRLLSAAF